MLVEHYSPAQGGGAEHGLLTLPGGPLNCIGYWTISIYIIIIIKIPRTAIGEYIIELLVLEVLNKCLNLTLYI